MLQEPATHGMARLMERDGLFLSWLEHVGFLLHAGDDPLDGRLKVLHDDICLGVSCGDEGGLVAHVADVCACVLGGGATEM